MADPTTDLFSEELLLAQSLSDAAHNADTSLDHYTRGMLTRAAGMIRELITEIRIQSGAINER